MADSQLVMKCEQELLVVWSSLLNYPPTDFLLYALYWLRNNAVARCISMEMLILSIENDENLLTYV